MASDDAGGRAAPNGVELALKTLLRWREVLRFATRPSDAHLTTPSDVLMVFEGDAIAFEDADGAQLTGEALAGKSAALVLFEDSCYDLTLTLPPAPLPEFKAMIRNEINFASPFPEEEAHAFWRANEQADGDWVVHVGVVLKSEVARALETAADQGVHLSQVVRLGEDDTSTIYATPDWLTGVPTAPARFPRALMLPVAAFGLFVLSLGAHMGLTALQAGDLRAEAEAADQQLRRAASTVGFQRSVDKSIAGARQNIETLALLSARLPDDTWLNRITIEKDSVRMIGFGPSGAETVRLLSDMSGVTNPRTIGTVTRDNSQNVERFIIEFDFVRPVQ